MRPTAGLDAEAVDLTDTDEGDSSMTDTTLQGMRAEHVPFGDLRASLIAALDELSEAEEAHAQASRDLTLAESMELHTAAEMQRKRIAAKQALTAYGVESSL